MGPKKPPCIFFTVHKLRPKGASYGSSTSAQAYSFPFDPPCQRCAPVELLRPGGCAGSSATPQRLFGPRRENQMLARAGQSRVQEEARSRNGSCKRSGDKGHAELLSVLRPGERGMRRPGGIGQQEERMFERADPVSAGMRSGGEIGRCHTKGICIFWAAMRISAILQKSARVQALRAENIRLHVVLSYDRTGKEEPNEIA